MQFFNIGFGEILFILIIAVIVLGPERIVSSARQAGKLIRQVVSSPFWREMMKTQAELRQLPRQLMSESGLDKDVEDIRKEMQGLSSSIRMDTNQIMGDIDQKAQGLGTIQEDKAPDEKPQPDEKQ